MMIYHYSPDTGEYTGSSEAQESPLEPGVPLIPQFATTDAPPAVSSHEAAVWDGSAWQVMPDYRAVVICQLDAEDYFVSVKPMQVGEPLAADLVLAEAPAGIKRPRWDGAAWIDGRTLQEVHDEKITEIKQEANRRILAKWPDYYQRNAALGLLDLGVVDQVKADIQAVRAASDSMEAEVLLLTEPGLADAYEVAANAGWPVV